MTKNFKRLIPFLLPFIVAILFINDIVHINVFIFVSVFIFGYGFINYAFKHDDYYNIHRDNIHRDNIFIEHEMIQDNVNSGVPQW